MLVVIGHEPGEAIVRAQLESGVPCLISAVNLAEVTPKLVDRGASLDDVRLALNEFELRVEPFDADAALRSGDLRRLTARAGLSLGDRACLELAIRRQLPVVTADRVWMSLDLPVTIILARPT